MRAYSPPRALRRVFAIGFLLLISKPTHGEVLLLPDLVIIRDAEPDIPLPNLFPDLTESWHPTAPRYRRQYKISVEDLLEPPKSLPDNLPLINPVADTGAPLLLGAVTAVEVLPSQPGDWSASATLDIREGGDFGASHAFEKLGEIGGRFFIPFSRTGPRPWSGEIGWERNGLFSGDVSIGAKEGSRILPYLTAALNWNRGINQPDSYFLELYHYGLSAYRISVLGGIDLSFQLEESNWSIITKIEGGLSHSMSDTEANARGVFALGLDIPGYGLLGKIGADLAYGNSDGIQGIPFLGFEWLVDDGISVYAHTEISMGYPDNLKRVFRRERVSSFEAQIPIHSRYRVGIAQVEKKRVSYLLEMSYAEGSFCEADNNVVVSKDDRRMRVLASIAYNFGSQRINLSGRLDFSLLGLTDIWEGRVELASEKLSYYIFSGSQDAILAEFFGGSRGEGVIIGMGLNWDLDENWEVGASAYARVPWDNPSLKLMLVWKSIGVVND